LRDADEASDHHPVAVSIGARGNVDRMAWVNDVFAYVLDMEVAFIFDLCSAPVLAFPKIRMKPHFERLSGRARWTRDNSSPVSALARA
jgi:hypothetical protein